jgi:3D (Asp-Asp-Asp) domain-containing protein
MIKLNHAIIGSVLPVFVLTMYFSNMMDETWAENMMLKEKVTHMEGLLNIEQYDVTATIYNPVRSQTDKTPHITADGTRLDVKNASKYRFVALSRDLLKRWGGPFDYGDYIIVEGCNGKYDGIWQVKDTMNERFHNRIDFLQSKGTKLNKFDNAVIYKYEKISNTILANK